MGKHSKQNGKAPKGQAGRSAPYQKPRIEVRYEGGAAPATSAPSAGLTAKAKGKARAEPPATLPPALDPSVSLATAGAASSSASEAGPSSGPTFIITAGSYEKILYGLEGSFPSGSDAPVLHPIFIFPAHLACVKAVAASPGGKWLATGSEDEFIKVWDLRRRKEVGSLSQHSGSITSLHFPTSAHLLATSEDATLSLFRTSDWALLKSLKGHSGRVNDLDVHPTGRVALSVGKDQTLKMWDLMRGRGAASLALGQEAEIVKFSPAGTHFAVLFPKKIELYSLTLKLLKTIETKSRFHTLAFASLPPTIDEEDETEMLCVGTEKGVVEVYEVKAADQASDENEDEDKEDEEVDEEAGTTLELERIGTLVGHSNRIKSVSVLPFEVPTPNGSPRRCVLLTSVSSDGLINVYDLTALKTIEAEAETKAIASYDTKGSRLTCVFLADGKQAPSSVNGNVPKKLNGAAAKSSSGVTPGAALDNSEDDEDNEIDESHDIYEAEQNGDEQDEGEEEESGSEDEDADGMEVEFEDEEEEEEEEEDEGEYD